jgi:hypothetical protein
LEHASRKSASIAGIAQACELASNPLLALCATGVTAYALNLLLRRCVITTKLTASTAGSLCIGVG